MRLGDSMRTARSLGLTLIAGLALASATAHAKPGDHIRLGKTVITPSLTLGFQWRSNAFRAQAEPQAAGNLSIRPQLAAVLDTPDVTFALDAAYTARKFVFLTTPENFGDDQRSSQIRALDRFNSVSAGLKIDGLRTRQVGLNLSERFVVANNPNDGDILDENPYVTQIRNQLSGGVAVRPGPALSIGLNANWGWARFFVPGGGPGREALNTRNTYGPSMQVKWLFLPRTAWVFNLSYTYNNWADESPDPNTGITTTDSHYIRGSTGLQGRITERLKLVARVGYGTGIYPDSNSPGTSGLGGLLVALQGTYDLTDKHSLMAGYRKTFFDSYFTNVNQVNALYARWRGKYGERFTSNLQYGIRFENFRGDIARNDVVNQLQLGLGVKLTDWWNLNADGSWIQRRSREEDGVEYDDFRAGLNTTLLY